MMSGKSTPLLPDDDGLIVRTGMQEAGSAYEVDIDV
jgi:hypothetical protein